MKHKLLSKNEQLEETQARSCIDELYEVKNTTQLQLQSLNGFAFALGYVLTDYPFETNYFYSNKKYNKHRQTISIANMIKLHDGFYTDWHGNRFRDPFRFSDEQTKAAWEMKLVAKCKLQYSKKKRKFITQNHVVEFTKEIYQETLL